MLAWRPEDLDAAGIGFAASVAGAVTTRIALERLGPDDAVALARALHPGGDDDAVRALAARAEGLPLYLVEAAAGDASVPGLATGGDGTLVRERLATLGGSATQVLTAAAVIGRSFEPGTVRRASGRSEDEVVDALDELLARGIVRGARRGRGRRDRYDFAHGLIRDVVYEGTSLARRRLLHRRVADALRAGPRGRDDVARLTRIASHEQAAGRDAEAAEAYREAGTAPRSSWPRRRASGTSRRPSRSATPIVAISMSAHRRAADAARGDYPGALRSLEAAAAVVDRPALVGLERALGRGPPPARRRDDRRRASRGGRWRPCLRTTDHDRARLLAARADRRHPPRGRSFAAAAIRGGGADAGDRGVGDRATIRARPSRGGSRGAGRGRPAGGDRGAGGEPRPLAGEPGYRCPRGRPERPRARVGRGGPSRRGRGACARTALADVRSIGDRHLEAVVGEHPGRHAPCGRAATTSRWTHLKRAVAAVRRRRRRADGPHRRRARGLGARDLVGGGAPPTPAYSRGRRDRTRCARPESSVAGSHGKRMSTSRLTGSPDGRHAGPRPEVRPGQRRHLEHALRAHDDLAEREPVVGERREQVPVEGAGPVVAVPALAGGARARRCRSARASRSGRRCRAGPRRWSAGPRAS